VSGGDIFAPAFDLCHDRAFLCEALVPLRALWVHWEAVAGVAWERNCRHASPHYLTVREDPVHTVACAAGDVVAVAGALVVAAGCRCC